MSVAIQQAHACPGCQQKEAENASLKRQIAMERDKVKRYEERWNWETRLFAISSKQLSGNDKLVAWSLRPMFQNMRDRGVSDPEPVYLPDIAERMGGSVDTVSKSTTTLDAAGGAKRVVKTDPNTKRTRVLLAGTETYFEAPESLAPPKTRTHGGRPDRGCPNCGARAPILIRKTTRTQHICKDCGEILRDETDVHEAELLPVEETDQQDAARSDGVPATVEPEPPVPVSSPVFTVLRAEGCGPVEDAQADPPDQAASCGPVVAAVWDGLEPIPGNFPAELVSRRRWMYSKVEWDAKRERWDKPPYSPYSRRKASKTDPGACGTVYEALAAMRQHGAECVGVALTEDMGMVVVDLDHCRDRETGAIEAWAQRVIDALPGACWEVSPSGTGLRGFMRGQKPTGSSCRWKVDGREMEVYSAGAWLTVTGHVLPGTPARIRDCTVDLAALWERCRPPEPAQRPRPPVVRLRLGDEGLLERARSAANGAKFSRLYDAGDTSEYGGDSSRAEAALCALLAFHTQDIDQMDRLMRRSALLQDPERLKKWGDRHYASGETYGEHTIDYALRLTWA